MGFWRGLVNRRRFGFFSARKKKRSTVKIKMGHLLFHSRVTKTTLNQSLQSTVLLHGFLFDNTAKCLEVLCTRVLISICSQIYIIWTIAPSGWYTGGSVCGPIFECRVMRVGIQRRHSWSITNQSSLVGFLPEMLLAKACISFEGTPRQNLKLPCM